MEDPQKQPDGMIMTKIKFIQNISSINLNGKVNRFLVPWLTLLEKLVQRTMKSSLCELQGAVAVLAEIDQDVQRLLHGVRRPQGVQHLLKKTTTSQL